MFVNVLSRDLVLKRFKPGYGQKLNHKKLLTSNLNVSDDLLKSILIYLLINYWPLLLFVLIKEKQLERLDFRFSSSRSGYPFESSSFSSSWLWAPLPCLLTHFCCFLSLPLRWLWIWLDEDLPMIWIHSVFILLWLLMMSQNKCSSTLKTEWS